MTARNTTQHYGSVAKVFHWLTALLILMAIPLGLIANGMAFDTGEALATKARLFSLHKTVGVAAFIVAVARILWAFTQPKPAGLHPERQLESFMAEMVHWLLYASLVIVPLSGWIHHAATTGFAPIYWPFGQSLPLVSKSEAVAGTFAAMHFVFTKVLAVSILLHIAGAVKHAVIDKDATLARMLPGDPKVNAQPVPKSRTPMLAAFVIFALGLAVALAWPGHDTHETSSVTPLEVVASDWQVTDGDIAITIEQLGSKVTGNFADWTAAISFDETAEGKHGNTEVTIAVGSLTLGSVTAQALGDGFFEAEAFPTAVFKADLLRGDAGYIAEGTLTIREIEMPLSMPFELEIDGDKAVMNGAVTIDRRSYEIGQQYKDTDGLGWLVEVAVSVTATQE